MEGIFATASFALSRSRQRGSSCAPGVEFMLPGRCKAFVVGGFCRGTSFFGGSFGFVRRIYPNFCFELDSNGKAVIGVEIKTVGLCFECGSTSAGRIFINVAHFTTAPRIVRGACVRGNSLGALIRGGPRYAFLGAPTKIFARVAVPISRVYRKRRRSDVDRTQIVFDHCGGRSSVGKFRVPRAVLVMHGRSVCSFFRSKHVPSGRASCITSFGGSCGACAFSGVGELIGLYHSRVCVGRS